MQTASRTDSSAPFYHNNHKHNKIAVVWYPGVISVLILLLNLSANSVCIPHFIWGDLLNKNHDIFQSGNQIILIWWFFWLWYMNVWLMVLHKLISWSASHLIIHEKSIGSINQSKTVRVHYLTQNEAVTPLSVSIKWRAYWSISRKEFDRIHNSWTFSSVQLYYSCLNCFSFF